MSQYLETVRQVKRKLELLEQKDALESERNILDPEVHKLKIIAHNEQADVENMQGASMKGFLLGLIGKKQEALEKEQAEARIAKQNYDLAFSRLETVLHKLEQCNEELASMDLCEDQLRELIEYPEDASLSVLANCSAKLPEIQDTMTTLMTELITVSKLGAFRSGTGSTSSLAGTDDKLLAAERRAQNLITQLKSELTDFVNHLTPFGISVDIDDLRKIEDDYLTDLFSHPLITSRVDNITIVLRQLRFRLDAVKPVLSNTLEECRREYLRALIAAAAKP